MFLINFVLGAFELDDVEDGIELSRTKKNVKFVYQDRVWNLV